MLLSLSRPLQSTARSTFSSQYPLNVERCISVGPYSNVANNIERVFEGC